GSLKPPQEWILDKYYTSIQPDGSKANLIRGIYPSIHQLNHHRKLFFDELYRLKTRGGAILYIKDHLPLVWSDSECLVGAG
ncbi:transposase, partial [Pseudomonas syringae pv. tagetis]